MYNGLKLVILGIFVVICLSNSPFSTSFGEEDKVKWIIEDQQITPEQENDQTSKTKNQNIFQIGNSGEEKRQQAIELELFILKIHDGDFVSGSSYSQDGELISPTSADGENINEILRAQKEQMKENWLHKIQYHNRFNDGYIEIAEAMLDPIGDPKFVISGQKFDTNPNSNLEYYLRERGYDINDPSSIPNHVFNPVKYADARNALEQSGHYTGIDLSQVNDYYKPLSDEQIQEFLIEDIGKQTATMQHNIFEKIASSFESEYNSELNSDIQYSSKSTVNRIDDSLFTQSAAGGKLFQNTKHILQSPNVGLAEIEPDYEVISILGIIIATIFLAIIGYTVLKKRKSLHENEILLPEIITEVNVTKMTLAMIEESLELLGTSKKKEAHEKLSHAIRYYYSNKIGVGNELNSSELIQLLKKQKLPHSKKIKNWLEFCGMVEFAKHDVNQTKFYNIISSFRKELK